MHINHESSTKIHWADSFSYMISEKTLDIDQHTMRQWLERRKIYRFPKMLLTFLYSIKNSSMTYVFAVQSISLVSLQPLMFQKQKRGTRVDPVERVVSLLVRNEPTAI